MRKYLAIIALMAVAFAGNVMAQSGYSGNLIQPVLYCVADTTSLSATWDKIVEVSGDGILYSVMFNSSSASKDPSVRLTVDTVVDSVTEANAEEATRYVVRGSGATSLQSAATGAEDAFAAVDSTYSVLDLNIPFGNYLRIDAHCEDATAQTRVWVLYGVNE